MAPNISLLRRWFAMGAIFVVLAVTGAYLYARWRIGGGRVFIPSRISMKVQQSAKQFTVSKSEQGRTVFTIHASNAVQYREGGNAELHDVTITVFGRDSQRFDQIYGSDFEYLPASGNVVAKGEVHIDLQANPQGTRQPDQSVPPELKNPVHLVTSGLVFNQKTGDAHTAEKVTFSVPQASGSAVGVKYTARDGLLSLTSQVDLTFSGATATRLNAARGAISKDPRQIELDRPQLEHGSETMDSDHGTIFLRPNNTAERALATGNVHIQVKGNSVLEAHADRAEFALTGSHNDLRNAVLSGNVRMESRGVQTAEAEAARVILNFKGKNLLATARAEGNVKMTRHAGAATGAAPGTGRRGTGQDTEITAAAIDFGVRGGRRLESATTSGAAQIALIPAQPGGRTVITAGKFESHFDEGGHLKTVHGAPDARIVNTVPGSGERVSTSRQVEAAFLPAGSIDWLQQDGAVAYADAERKAWGEHARYTPADQMLRLTGSPRVVAGGMTTTAQRIRLNRGSGEALAEGDVKTTYSDLKAQPGGALLASASPIHVTAHTMATRRDPGVATYTGNARLWQDSNVVQAAILEFDRNRRFVTARGASGQPVSTVLVESGKGGKRVPVLVTANYLTYADDQRKVHYENSVVARADDATLTADQSDVYLRARPEPPGTTGSTPASALGSNQLEKIVADGHVTLVQPERRAQGNHLVYTAGDDKYVLTGGSPSIFDAEHGKVTGDSLTFYKRDDRVLVQGDGATPAVTETRVAR